MISVIIALIALADDHLRQTQLNNMNLNFELEELDRWSVLFRIVCNLDTHAG